MDFRGHIRQHPTKWHKDVEEIPGQFAMNINSLRPSDAYLRRLSNHHWFVAWSAPSHYLNQCWNIVDRTLRSKLQWNFNRNSKSFIQENAFESVVCDMATILSRPQCVKSKPQLIPTSKTSHKPPSHISFSKQGTYGLWLNHNPNKA